MIRQFKYFNAVLFNDNSIEAIRTYHSVKLGIFNFFLGIFFLSLPLTYEEIFTTPASFMSLLGKFLLALFLCFGFARLLKSKSSFEKFFYTVGTVNMFAAVPIVVLSYFCLYVLEGLLNIGVVSQFIVSVIPYYLFILFGFSVEGGAQFSSEKKSVVLGVFSIVTIYSLYFFL